LCILLAVGFELVTGSVRNEQYKAYNKSVSAWWLWWWYRPVLY